MAPTTTFEDTSGAEWTPLADEATFLQTVAAETDADLSVAGTSVQDRPLWRVDLGSDAAQSLTVVALQHANEFATREAALQWLRDLAYSTDPGIVDYLAAHRVVVMPTANPDGFALGQVSNADGRDINRDVYVLLTPEQRAIQAVINNTAPDVLLDCHEHSQFTGIDMTYRRAETAALYPGLGGLADQLIAAVGTALDGESISHGLFPIPGRFSLRESAAMHHCVSVLFESWFGAGSAPLQRVSDYLATLEACREWHDDNAATCAEVAEASRTYQATTTGPYVLQHGTTNYPWPQTPLPIDLTGYDLQGSLPQRFIDAYSITVDGDQVALSQQARAVIPILLDEVSDDQVVTTTRILGDDPEPPGPGVGDTLPVGVFSPVVRWVSCDLVSGEIIADLPDLTGSVSRILGASTSSSLTLPIPSLWRRILNPKVRRSNLEQATVPGRTMLVAVVNELPCWGGMVLRRNGGTDATLQLACATLESYLGRRVVRDHTWTQRDESTVIAAGLAGDAGTILGVGSGIGLEVDARPTGQLRDREYVLTDRAWVYDRLQELMAVRGGPEWTIELLWGDDTQTWVRKVLRIRDRIGVASDKPTAVFETTAAAVFSSQGSSEARYTYDEDYSSGKGANYVVAYSTGEGDDQPASVAAIDQARLDAGWPIYEHHWQPASNITRQSTLDSYAERELQLLHQGARTWTIDARWNVIPRLNIEWRIGDDIAWSLVGHRHPGGVSGQGRCIGWELDPVSGVVRPTLLDPLEAM